MSAAQLQAFHPFLRLAALLDGIPPGPSVGPEGKPIDARDTVRQVLRRLGRDLTEENRDSEPRDKLEARLYQPAYEDVCRVL